jgi:hypothetical protein
VKAFIVPITLGFVATGFLATSANAQSLQVIGYAGYLGEWELTAALTENVSSQPKQYSGPLTMKHVGLCTQDGPEEKTGEMRIDISPSPPVLNATLSIAGIECSYRGRLSESYSGTMNCPDRQAVPLKLWVK